MAVVLRTVAMTTGGGRPTQKEDASGVSMPSRPDPEMASEERDTADVERVAD
jgi:hypothetical protein